MKRITSLRMFVASLAGAAAFFIVPAICIVAAWLQMPYLNADGTPDNAPLRGVVAFVLFSPVLFLVIATFGFLGGLFLQRIDHLTSRVLLYVVAIASVAVGILPATDSQFGWRDALLMFGMFAGLTLAASGIYAWVWWKVATRSNSSSSGRVAGGAGLRRST